MNGEFPEQFKCPVCFEIPEWEIFQCQNGHTICDECAENLSTCPQCRVSLGTPKIRCRPLEDILDMMKFDCSYKPKGCATKVTRKEITSHFENCLFGGKQTRLCKFLGYNCSHIVNTKRLQESLNHLQKDHKCLLTNNKEFDMKLRNVKDFSTNSSCIWMPIIVNAFNSHYLIVICSAQSNMSFTCISLGEKTNDKIFIKFRMVSKKDNIPALEWTTTPVPHDKSEVILKSPSFRLPFSYLLENYLEQKDLAIHINITDIPTDNVSRKLEVLAVDYDIVLRPSPSGPFRCCSLTGPSVELGSTGLPGAFGSMVPSLNYRSTAPSYASSLATPSRVYAVAARPRGTRSAVSSSKHDLFEGFTFPS